MIHRYKFTARELEVAYLIVDGASNPSIAEILQISVPTVKSHVVNILNKIGADSRAAIAAIMHRL